MSRFMEGIVSFVRSKFNWGARFNFGLSGEDGLRDSQTTWELILRRCESEEELIEKTQQCIHHFFPSLKWCCLFLRDERNRLMNLVVKATLPNDGICKQALIYKGMVQNQVLQANDPLHGIVLQFVSADILQEYGVSWLPFPHKKTNCPALLLFISEAIVESQNNMEWIRLIQRSVISTISYMFFNRMSHSSMVLSRLDCCDDSSASSQLCILAQVMEKCVAEFGFYLTFEEKDDGFILYVMDGKRCEPPPRFTSVDLPILTKMMKGLKSHVLPYNAELLAEMELILEAGNARANGSRLKNNTTLRQIMVNPVHRRNIILGVCILLSTSTQRFTLDALNNSSEILSTASTILHKDIIIERERLLRQQNERLHQVAKNLFTHLDDLTVLLKEIMQEARNMTQAERCSVFLLENDATELVAKVFDGHIADTQEVRMSSKNGIAGHVIQTGKILNIKDAYSHPLFYKGVDESTGFKTRNILCFPIKDEKDNIIGAAQLCNKKIGKFFTHVDEDIARALSSYCCISIVHSLMYRDVLDAHNRVRLANELMMFHMHVPDEDVVQLCQMKVPTVESFGAHLKLTELSHSLPRHIPLDKTPLACISMLDELGFTQLFKIKSVTLARFVLMARKGYRDPPYHNWSHAFSVCHFAFLMLKRLNLITNKTVSEIEALAYFVAALCHDIDHRGTTNSFQVASKSVLAALYSSEGSVMERHHFSQTMCILNTEGCNIFENVSRQQYEQLLDLMRDIILSTDIAHHLRIRNGLEAIAKEGFNPKSPQHRNLVLCLLMTSADLSDQTKPWKSTKTVSKMLYKEFFSQGDLEKALGRSPIEMMDREKAQIPGLQIGFIDHIVLPCYKTLALVFPTTRCLVDMIGKNREHWESMRHKTESRRESVNSLDVFDDNEEEDENIAENGVIH